jgi:phosphoribosylformylglycinamidine cyclo-ligase
MAISYKESGVDIEKGDLFVEKISSLVKSTYNQQVVSGVGGFCALYALDEDRYLASSTDGVGTKIKLAIDLNLHETIGIDLVAMCVNDLICSGAKPLFFLDYFASSHLDLEVSQAVIKGIVNGCLQSQMVLIGGETAEMPGMYQPGDYDLAGFSVGEVDKNKIIDGKNIFEGDYLVALESSGFHSNGFSLVRKLLDLNHASFELKTECLTPTKIYVRSILSLLKNSPQLIKGLSNITGSGYLNIPRMNESFDYFIDEEMPLPKFMDHICKLSGLSLLELHRTFNMGAGMVIATSYPNELMEELQLLGEKAKIIGTIKNGTGKVFIKGENL